MRTFSRRFLPRGHARVLSVESPKSMATPLLTKEQRDKLRGWAFKYARDLLIDPSKMQELGVGRAPFAHIDAETIAQRAYTDGYTAALRAVKKGEEV